MNVPYSDDDPFLLKHLPGSEPSILEIRRQIAVLNSSFNRDLIRNVLITGKLGTGKSYLAQLISSHRQYLESVAKGGVDVSLPLNLGGFAVIDLAGLHGELIERELFGTVKGAFTGAVNSCGLLGNDSYKDILLDEIGDLSLAFQPKLLRLLNDRKFRRLGDGLEKEKTTDARFILATNRNLKVMVREGSFREDLLWRCAEFVIHVPPLRSRSDGIIAIAERILEDLKEKQNVEHLTGGSPALSQDDCRFIRGYGWPGNIRQLKHAIARMLAYRGVPLSECALAFERELLFSRSEEEEMIHSRITKCVSYMLDRGAREQSVLAHTPGEFIDQLFSHRARVAMAKWLEKNSLKPSTLEAMFPGAKDANSIRSTIMKWRDNK